MIRGVVFLTGELSHVRAVIFNLYAKTAFSIAAIKQNDSVSINLALGLEACNEMMFYVLDLKIEHIHFGAGSFPLNFLGPKIEGMVQNY